MNEYHKIDSIFKRDERGRFLIGEFSRPEFEYLKDNLWLWTEKIDGTNIRIIYKGDELNFRIRSIEFRGKTDNAQIPTKLLTGLTHTTNLDLFKEVFGNTDVYLYGEGYGAGIQGGGNYSPNQKFILFDIKIGNWWLERKNVEDIAQKLRIDVVPIEGTWTLTEMIEHMFNVKSVGDEAPTSNIGTAIKEGYVGIPLVPLFTRNGDRIITKIKYKDWIK